MRAKTIVFVHRLADWGPKDLVGKFPYWGDALAQFSRGFRACEAKRGPVSSLHDRACEVCAQIKGAPIDYGASHGEAAGDPTLERWRASDGCVNSISQRYPFLAGAHPAGGEGVLAREDMAPGCWCYENIEDAVGRQFDHQDPVHGPFQKPSRRLREDHRRLYREIEGALPRL